MGKLTPYFRGVIWEQSSDFCDKGVGKWYNCWWLVDRDWVQGLGYPESMFLGFIGYWEEGSVWGM